MCGIAGFWENKLAAGDRRSQMIAMLSTLRSRGPDSFDVWRDSGGGLTLGHTRLSIVELSPLGAQPMVSASGQGVLSFNGEIYNFKELRSRLLEAGIAFRGFSDTEVLLEGLEYFGVEEMLQMCNGMFAFAYFDKPSGLLYLVRDRVGIKPLYYGYCSGVLLFASQLMALKKFSNFDFSLSDEAMRAHLAFGYIPQNLSIYEHVKKLPAGTFLRISKDQLLKGDLPAPISYWSLVRKLEPLAVETEQAAIDLIETKLGEAVARRMVADVPLGAFLSGGIDSSLIVALLAKRSTQPVKTFSIGFNERAFNEAPYARKVAEHLGTEHVEMYISPKEALAFIPQYAEIFDEPFADVSGIPTYFLAKLARSHVLVSLSGDGGDELFGGYDHYQRALKYQSLLDIIPRRLLHALAYGLPPLASAVDLVSSELAYKLQKLSLVVRDPRREVLFEQIIRHWNLSVASISTPKLTAMFDDLQFFTSYDILQYLADDILVKLDRATMGVGLEGRVPMLDHEFIETVVALPSVLRFQPGKELLRKVLSRYLPRIIFERPKAGFDVPIGSWLRGPLSEWASDLMSDLSPLGHIVDTKLVKLRWKQHQSGSYNWDYLLWDVLTLKAWLEANR